MVLLGSLKISVKKLSSEIFMCEPNSKLFSGEPSGTYFIARIPTGSLFFLQLILSKIWFP
jgi:hypothetical protein